MYNIKREGRSDFMLGCSVHLPETAMHWLLYYVTKYPQFRFDIVVTDYAGDMADVLELIL